MPAPAEHPMPTETPVWRRWLGRAVTIGLVIAVLYVAAPTLQGSWYGVFPPAPVPADQLPDWRDGYELALAEAAETGRPVLIDFTAGWCPPCRVMDAKTWPDETLRVEIAARVIPLRLDVDRADSGPAARRYGITTIPAVVLVDAAGEEIAREGYASARRLRSFLREHAPEVHVAPPAPALPAPPAPPAAEGTSS